MINHHPDDNLLVEFASGSLPRALAISVKTHLSFCQRCRSQLHQLEAVGSALMSDIHTAPETNSSDFSTLMQRIRQQENHTLHTATPATKEPQATSASSLPLIVDKLIAGNGKLHWQRITPSLKQARLHSGQNEFEVCLHQIRRGGKVPEHDHRGREATVVLKGVFSDEHGCYQQGDFVWREPGQSHRPAAAQDQDCLCLSVVEAPVYLTGFMGKLINPLLAFKPS